MWLIYSLIAALCFGLRGVMYQWTSRKPANRNLMLFGTFFMGALASCAAIVVSEQSWVPASWIGCIMGVLSFIANSAMYRGYAVGKASLVALFTGLPPVVVVCLAYLLWGQTLSALQFAAFLAIVAGILIIRYSSSISLDTLKGIQWAIIALLGFGLNDTTSTWAMRLDAELFPTMFFMFATGSALFGSSWVRERLLAKRHLNTLTGASREESAAAAEKGMWSARRTVGWGMVVGTTNFAGMYFILHAFDQGIAGLVSAVTALNVLIILVYASLFLKERFTLKEAVGGICALAGVMTLHLAG